MFCSGIRSNNICEAIAPLSLSVAWMDLIFIRKYRQIHSKAKGIDWLVG